MIKDSGKKLFDVVLVWKFDCFARNRFDSANYKMILKKNGVHLIPVMEPIAEGSQGILVETLLEGMAEYYSAELSERVIRGQTENALKGKCTGGTGTIGYKIDEDKFYHLDPLTSPLVLEAFQQYDMTADEVEGKSSDLSSSAGPKIQRFRVRNRWIFSFALFCNSPFRNTKRAGNRFGVVRLGKICRY